LTHNWHPSNGFPLAVLDGELAVPCSPKSAHAGSKILPEKQELGVNSFGKRGGRTSFDR
jgi:hypothetical protein